MLIGLNGFKGVGKDTVGQYLVDRYGFERLAFADKLKQAAAALLDIPLEDVDQFKNLGASVTVMGKPMSFRMFLQRFGTEMGREVFGEDFWVDQLIPTTSTTWHLGHKYVITDARFENELEAIHAAGGNNVRIIRPGYVPDGHASEIAPSPVFIDHILYNDGSLEDLKAETSAMLDIVGGF